MENNNEKRLNCLEQQIANAITRTEDTLQPLVSLMQERERILKDFNQKGNEIDASTIQCDIFESNKEN